GADEGRDVQFIADINRILLHPGDDVFVHNFHLHGTEQYLIFSLEWFEVFLSERRAVLRPERVDGRYKDKILDIYQRSSVAADRQAWAKWRWKVEERGYLSCSASRAMMLSFLQQPASRERIGKLLAARFAEVIVDESQDCGAEEIELLRFISARGVSVAMVGDPDQSIFVFRDAQPAEVRRLGQELGSTERMAENFRSSPAICKAVRSLRSGTAEDVAAGPNKNFNVPIVLLGYAQPSEIPGAIAAICSHSGLEHSQAMLLSHRGSDACQAAGLKVEKAPGSKKVLHFARASLTIRHQMSTPTQRKKAHEAAKRALVDLIEGVSTANDSCDAICRSLNLPVRWLDAAAYRLSLGPDPYKETAKEYAGHLRKLIPTLAWPDGIQLKTLGDHIKAPSEAEWTEVIQDVSPTHLRWATIHSVKGAQFPLVGLVTPKKLLKDDLGQTVLDHWEHGLDTEAKRVLYVGASRAEKILVLILHKSHAPQVLSILHRDYVPFTTFEAYLQTPLDSSAF
ncbi:MAG: ATP-dependent helicase, partial [Cytophagaceae bacterium]